MSQTDRARTHFEIALRQAHDLPLRLVQPSVRYWHGRMLARHTDPVEQSRGRALVEEASADFRFLGMVLNADLAERFLREPQRDACGPPTSR